LTRNAELLAFLSPRLPAGFLPSANEAFLRPAFLAKFASASRKCGAGALALTRKEADELARSDRLWLFGGAPLDEAARVALLLDADTRLGEAEMLDLATDCFRRGDNGERRAVLRSLAVLTDPARYVDLAAQACRSHVQTVFEALACENPFPASFFPELNFNQMVLKALFTGVALDRVMGLDTRLTSELSRMANDYADERRAAGRTVPQDIGRLLAKEDPK
jgi:hypothetical protein